MLADEIQIDRHATGRNIKDLMDRKNFTLKSLAYLTGLTTNTIRNYINGYNSPSLTNLYVIALALDAEINDIIVYIRNDG